MTDPDFKVDPAKIDARLAQHEAEEATLDRVAESLEMLADDKRREASRLRGQNIALLKTARKHGYPASPNSETES